MDDKKSEITPTTFPKYKKPALNSLPDYLKEPDNYEKIERAIIDAGATKHSHAEIGGWFECAECQRAMWNRKEFIKKLGFTSGAQYLSWKKTHEQIKRIRRVKFDKYNS